MIVWTDRLGLELFFVQTLLHELGHHYVHIHRHRRKLPSKSKGHEYLADQWAARLTGRLAAADGDVPGSIFDLARRNRDKRGDSDADDAI